MSVNRRRILLIGPLPPPVGGATVAFAQLASAARLRDDLQLTIIDTSRKSPDVLAALSTGARALMNLIRSVAAADLVSLHASRRGSAILGPPVWLVTRLTGKPLIFRGFGDFRSWFERGWSPARELFAQTVLRSDAVLLESIAAVDYFARTRPNIRWYPNSRPIGTVRAGRTAATPFRFIFLGHVKPSKGIRELIAAARSIEVPILVDVYGPLLEGVQEGDFGGGSVRYRGLIEAGQAARLLERYDALVLPTYYEGEGYPGAILEAYAAGLPVVATRWNSLPEIVDERCGILVEPRDSGALAAAMRQLATNPLQYAQLCAGARERAEKFSSSRWTDKFVEICFWLIDNQR